MEQGEYQKEEIDWSYVEFVDNQDVVDLIEKVCFINLSVSFLYKDRSWIEVCEQFGYFKCPGSLDITWKHME